MLIGLIIYIVSVVIIIIGVRYFDFSDDHSFLVFFTLCPAINTYIAIEYIGRMLAGYCPNLNDVLYKLIKYGRKS